MGRRRKNELKPGDNVTIYIPQDVEREVLHFMRTQANLSKTVFKILEGYVMRKTRDYIDFDDFYNEKNDEKFNLSTKSKEKALETVIANDELKNFIRLTVKDEIKSILENRSNNTKFESNEADLESKHEEKIKKVQNLIGSDETEKTSEVNLRDMDDLFSEFSKSIESENGSQKKVEIPKSYLWEYEDE